MSSGTIEREIVQLVFDAKDFAKGIKNSIDDISQLRKAADMSGAAESFNSLEKAADVDMSPFGKSLDGISYKMVALSTAAGIMLADIAQKVIGAAKSMADALVLTPIKTGLEEYETQINAVQVILANTAKAGTTLEDVTAALDELNEYADLTIYNFTEMTKNIGTFTAAGVELDTSVSAIKGIANLAAVSGSSAVQAATGMYQLSQAISSGTVKLMDWNSVQNAGMGGQIFQDALMETAKVHGIAIDNIIKNEGSFRDSLAKGWLSSEILLETLAKFTGDLTSEQLTQMGYTEEQIAQIIELGEMANDAATKIKTVTALKDTLNEALQSGWAVSWRLIIGDFEQAKVLWGQVAGFFSEIIEESSESRNAMIQVWADVGGRDLAIEGLFNLFRFGKRLMTNFQAALSDVFGVVGWRDLFQLTVAFANFAQALASNHEATRNFRRILRGLFSILKIVGLVIGAVLVPFQFLVPILKMAAKNFIRLVATAADIIFAFSEMAEKTDYFGKIVRLIIIYLKLFADIVQILVREFFALEKVQEVIAWFKEMVLPLLTIETLMYNLRLALMAVAAPFYLLAIAAKELYAEIMALEEVQEALAWVNNLSWDATVVWLKEVAASFTEFVEEVKAEVIALYDEFMALEEVQEVLAWMNDLSWAATVLWFQELGTSAREFFDEFKNNELVTKFLDYFKTFDGRRVKQLSDDGKENFSWVDSILGPIKDKLTAILPTFEEIKASVMETLGKVGEGLGKVLDYLISDANNLDYSAMFDVINAGLLSAVLLSIKNVFSGGWFSDSDIGEGLADVVEGLGDTLGTFQNNIRADTLQKIAISIALLAGSITLLALIPQDKLLSSSAAIAVMVGALFGASGALKAVSPQDAIKASVAITGLSVAITLFAVALKLVSDLDPDETAIGMGAMTVGLASLVLSMKGLSKAIGPDVMKSMGALLALTAALSRMVKVVKEFGEMDPNQLAKGIGAVAATLLVLVYALMLLGQGDGGSKLKATLALTAVAVALKKLIPVIETFGTMDESTLMQGLAIIAAILYGLSVFSQRLKTEKLLEASAGILIITASLFILSEVVKRFGEMDPWELVQGMIAIGIALAILVIAANTMQGTIVGAQAILLMSVALIAIAVAIKILSSLTWEELALALVAIVAVFVILGVAGYLLAPVVPILLLLGIAMLLIGVSAFLLGAGLLLAATGLVAIAGSAALIAKAIRVVGAAVIEILPEMAIAFAQALANFIITIGENAPAIGDAFKAIILSMIQAVTELIPDIVEAVWDMIIALLELIAEKMPLLVQAGFDILLGFIKGIEENIADIVTAGLGVLTEFIAGIEKGIPALVDQAFSLILTFLEAIAEAVELYFPQIVAAGIRIGEAIVEGLVDAIDAGLAAVKKAVLRLARKALDALGLGFLLGSPSKATYQIGKYFVQGFVNAITLGGKDVHEAVTVFAKEATGGLKDIVQSMNNEIDKALVFQPEIAPVLNLDAITSGMGALDDTFNNTGVLAALSYSGQAPTTRAAETTDEDRGVTFNQYNYSPKALDRPAIYRQTRTQVAKLKARELV